jgi:hypothetical protein
MITKKILAVHLNERLVGKTNQTKTTDLLAKRQDILQQKLKIQLENLRTLIDLCCTATPSSLSTKDKVYILESVSKHNEIEQTQPSHPIDTIDLDTPPIDIIHSITLASLTSKCTYLTFNQTIISLCSINKHWHAAFDQIPNRKQGQDILKLRAEISLATLHIKELAPTIAAIKNTLPLEEIPLIDFSSPALCIDHFVHEITNSPNASEALDILIATLNTQAENVNFQKAPTLLKNMALIYKLVPRHDPFYKQIGQFIEALQEKIHISSHFTPEYIGTLVQELDPLPEGSKIPEKLNREIQYVLTNYSIMPLALSHKEFEQILNVQFPHLKRLLTIHPTS